MVGGFQTEFSVRNGRNSYLVSLCELQKLKPVLVLTIKANYYTCNQLEHKEFFD